jgi:uncharacterized protein YodC (DUF2158 family)
VPIGTRVRLASGGPVMLVTAWDEDNREYVFCEWGDGQVERYRIVVLDVVRNHHGLKVGEQ